MGKFKAGTWIIILFIYFFTLFIAVNQIVSASNHYNIETDNIRYADPGFENFNSDFDIPDNASSSDTGSISDLKATVSVITGIGASQINIGVPSAFIYIFSILFFWIEFIMILWALYMAIPFFH